MAKPLGDFPFEDEVRELLEIARTKAGVSEANAAGYPALFELPAVAGAVNRLPHAADDREALGLTSALDDALELVEDEAQRRAARRLLGLDQTPGAPSSRASDAAEALGKAGDTFRRNRWRTGADGKRVWARSPEVQLMEKVKEALEEVANPRAATADFSPTPEGYLAAVAFDDVLGTWKGTLQTDWRDPLSGRRPDPMTSFMVFSRDGERLVTRHFVKNGQSVMVSQEIIKTPEGHRRLLGIYEGRAEDLDRKWEDPPHRGAMLLDVMGEPPAKWLTAVYWTDRRTTGRLKYQEWCSDTAETFEEAEALEGYRTRRPGRTSRSPN